MNLLFLGDIVGRPGRRALHRRLAELKRRLEVSLVVANGENSAGGAGITPKTAGELFQSGIDGITTGDHLWDQKEVYKLLGSEPRLVRPLNYPPSTPGQGWALLEKDSLPNVAVINLQGRTFMAALDNPFHAVDRVLDEIRKKTSVILVDMHAEATSEKIAMARYLDGRVSAVVGTHTHVQTADESIFPGGTGFLCDAGFTGAHDSVLGREVKPVVTRFLTNRPQRFEVAKHQVKIQGVLFKIDETSGKTMSVTRVSESVAD